MAFFPSLSRRSFIAGTAALAAGAMTGPARAGTPMVAAAFSGDTEDVLRRVLTPVMAEKGIDLVVAPASAQDQVARMLASPGNPPFDALYVSPGQTAELAQNGLIKKIDPSRIPSWSKLDPMFQTEYGPAIHLQVDGIAYNPSKVPAPKGYRDLFENPAYDGRVAYLGFGSNTAAVAWVELAKALGGGPDNMEPMFEQLADYLPKIGAIANNGSQQQSLYQQGEIDVFIASTGNVNRLKSLGLECEFVRPDTGSPALPVYIHLANGSQHEDAVYQYMEASISTLVQEQLKQPPLAYFATNSEVELPPQVAAYLTRADIGSLVYPDWTAINAHRAEWTERFNQVVAV